MDRVTVNIEDGAITNPKMASDSVDSDQYVDGSIDTVHIGDSQITEDKLAAGSVTDAKINDVAATKLTGTIDHARLPNINANKINTGELGSAVTANTPSLTDDSDSIATTEWTNDRLDALVNGAPGALNTLDELSEALGQQFLGAISTAFGNTNARTAIVVNAVPQTEPITIFNGMELAIREGDNEDIVTVSSDVSFAAGSGGVSVSVTSFTPSFAYTTDASVWVRSTAAWVTDSLALKANLASPTFTGTPHAPTASSPDTSTTQIATTAFVRSQRVTNFRTAADYTGITAGRWADARDIRRYIEEELPMTRMFLEQSKSDIIMTNTTSHLTSAANYVENGTAVTDETNILMTLTVNPKSTSSVLSVGALFSQHPYSTDSVEDFTGLKMVFVLEYRVGNTGNWTPIVGKVHRGNIYVSEGVYRIQMNLRGFAGEFSEHTSTGKHLLFKPGTTSDVNLRIRYWGPSLSMRVDAGAPLYLPDGEQTSNVSASQANSSVNLTLMCKEYQV